MWWWWWWRHERTYYFMLLHDFYVWRLTQRCGRNNDTQLFFSFFLFFGWLVHCVPCVPSGGITAREGGQELLFEYITPRLKSGRRPTPKRVLITVLFLFGHSLLFRFVAYSAKGPARWCFSALEFADWNGQSVSIPFCGL